jgi:hypothetical protein
MKTCTLLLMVVLLVSSCAPVYIPNVRNAPLFRQSGKFQGSVHIGPGLDLQGAVSVTDHLGLMVNFNNVNRTGTEDESDYVKHRFFEGGIGYYNNVRSICYEVFAGFGKGEGSSYDEYYFFGPGYILATGRYNRVFLQPSIGSNHRIFNWIFSARLSWVDFTEFEALGRSVYTNLDSKLFIEPSFTGRINFGESPLYGQFQFGLSWPADNSDYIDYEPLHLSFGLGIRLGGKP